MTPYFYAMDRINYSRWLPVYLADMQQLPTTHPAVDEGFNNGNHAVSRSDNPFSQVWTDMALEQFINLDSKSKGGIIGISQKPGALERWFLTFHERSAVTAALKEMCGVLDADLIGTHKEAAPKRVERDEHDVQCLLKSFASGLIQDPFTLDEEGDTPLRNIASGIVMPKDCTSRQDV